MAYDRYEADKRYNARNKIYAVKFMEHEKPTTNALTKYLAANKISANAFIKEAIVEKMIREGILKGE